MNNELIIRDTADAESQTAILEALKAYNLALFGESDRRELIIPLHDDDGKPVGGLVGWTGRGWLYTSLLFVPESMRGQGWATKLLATAENEARTRGCIGAYIDTMSPQARALYLKLGYTLIGELNPLTGGHTISWLQKRFPA